MLGLKFSGELQHCWRTAPRLGPEHELVPRRVLLSVFRLQVLRHRAHRRIGLPDGRYEISLHAAH